MNHYSSFLRPHHGKSSNLTNNENDENSSIKNLFFKHLSKNVSTTTNVKGTNRGILGEVGNTALANASATSIISKSKLLQQSTAMIIETKTTNVFASSSSSSTRFVSSNSSTTIPMMINRMEEILLNDDQSKETNEVPAQFDCDSGDTQNIITAAEYVVQICKYWRELEEQMPIRENFLINRPEGEENVGDFQLDLFFCVGLGTCSPQNRAVLIDWLYQVHDRFKLLSDTFHMTVQIIDRYLQSVDASKHDLQLIGSTGKIFFFEPKRCSNRCACSVVNRV